MQLINVRHLLLHRLQGQTVCSLLCSIFLRQFGLCACAVVRNSIEASASAISLWIHWSTLSIKLRDNGGGIDSLSMKLVGQLPATVNSNSGSSAKRGMSLRNIVALSASVTVHSSTIGGGASHSSFVRGKHVLHEEDTGMSITDIGRSGTTVHVSGLFASQPVRQKMISFRVEAERILKRATRVALVQPTVEFSIYEVDDESALSTAGTTSGSSGHGTLCLLRLPSASTMVARAASLFGADVAAALCPLDSEAADKAEADRAAAAAQAAAAEKEAMQALQHAAAGEAEAISHGLATSSCVSDGSSLHGDASYVFEKSSVVSPPIPLEIGASSHSSSGTSFHAPLSHELLLSTKASRVRASDISDVFAVSFHGFISPKHPSRNLQFFFINGKPCHRLPRLAASIEQAVSRVCGYGAEIKGRG